MSGDKTRVGAIDTIKSALNVVLDFALPPRCAGCGSIVGQLHSFCPDCWTEVEFLGDSGCTSCGLPLEATDAYGDLSRSIAIKLKYGRKVALARTMARYMAPLISKDGGAPILIPVPLHRTRLWQRGFNQSALVARELAKATGLRSEERLLRRVKRTPALQGMSLSQRRKTVAGAFNVDPSAELAGRTVVLIDDVLTTGSTANACARALKLAGAGARGARQLGADDQADAADLMRSE